MPMQATIILLLTFLIGAACPMTGYGTIPTIVDGDTVLRRVGHAFPAATIEGTMSLEGTMTIGNLPFVARVQRDTVVVTVQAPFGMTAGTVYVTPDTFIVVNYLSREALVGHPDSRAVAAVSPIPLNLSDVRAFLRGSLPGNLSRFQQGSQRNDGKLLYVARDTASTEFALIDTASSTIAQYQRKSRSGATLLNMVLGDVRSIESSHVPYAIDVDIDDKVQSVRFRFDVVEPRIQSAVLAVPDIPPSFTRRVYSR